MPRSLRVHRLLAALALASAACPQLFASYDNVADVLSERLNVSTHDGWIRAGLSGRTDLTLYSERAAAADLRYTEDRSLFAPSARLFGDAQVGDSLYGFAQLRADRGFDPGREAVETRIDEVALRISTPARDGLRASMQAGRFATVFGGWSRRHLTWEYPFATAPLAHENLVGLWDSKGATTPAKPAAWAHISPRGDSAAIIADERKRIPVIWGPVYATGAALIVGTERHEAAFEVKNVGLSSRPSTWSDTDSELWHDPALAARLGWRPTLGVDLGVSFARNGYLALKPVSILAGHDRGDYQQTTLGADFSYEWRHLLVWTELVAARFTVPGAGDADTFAATLEARYKFDVRLAAALRLDWQTFRDIHTPVGDTAWGRDVWRIEAGPVVRLAAQAQLKFFASLRHETPAETAWNPGVSSQLSLRF